MFWDFLTRQFGESFPEVTPPPVEVLPTFVPYDFQIRQWPLLGFEHCDSMTAQNGYKCRPNKRRKKLKKMLSQYGAGRFQPKQDIECMARHFVDKPGMLPILSDMLLENGYRFESLIRHFQQVPHDEPCYFISIFLDDKGRKYLKSLLAEWTR